MRVLKTMARVLTAKRAGIRVTYRDAGARLFLVRTMTLGGFPITPDPQV